MHRLAVVKPNVMLIGTTQSPGAMPMLKAVYNFSDCSVTSNFVCIGVDKWVTDSVSIQATAADILAPGRFGGFKVVKSTPQRELDFAEYAVSMIAFANATIMMSQRLPEVQYYPDDWDGTQARVATKITWFFHNEAFKRRLVLQATLAKGEPSPRTLTRLKLKSAVYHNAIVEDCTSPLHRHTERQVLAAAGVETLRALKSFHNSYEVDYE